MQRGSMEERVVAERLGVSRYRIRKLRSNLTAGADWGVDEERVVYSETGLKKIEAALGVSIPREETGEGAGDGSGVSEGAKKEGRDLTIERVCPNPTLVQVRIEGVLTRVRVRTNVNLGRGKVLRGCVQDEAGHWHFKGRCW